MQTNVLLEKKLLGGGIFFLLWLFQLKFLITRAQEFHCEWADLFEVRGFFILHNYPGSLAKNVVSFTHLHSISDKAAVTRDAAAELERMTRGKKTVSETNSNDTGASGS